MFGEIVQVLTSPRLPYTTSGVQHLGCVCTERRS
jgi:hypothetical protein